MAEFVNAAEVPKTWNMIILCHIPVVAAAMPQIFSCFVSSATEVNPTAAIVKYIIRKLGTIVVKGRQRKPNRLNLPRKNLHLLLYNAREQPRKGSGVKI
jgi:hypothetical protein